jgi:hypothetical protein
MKNLTVTMCPMLLTSLVGCTDPQSDDGSELDLNAANAAAVTVDDVCQKQGATFYGIEEARANGSGDFALSTALEFAESSGIEFGACA